ncbi:MAG: TonB-dependent receptor [Cytophagaceae bacterium]|jgi:outer membrane receptor for ferrienterochelin and colicins|nr:TonB-dependent receptor [Cytophagaceae bacterium]
MKAIVFALAMFGVLPFSIQAQVLRLSDASDGTPVVAAEVELQAGSHLRIFFSDSLGRVIPDSLTRRAAKPWRLRIKAEEYLGKELLWPMGLDTLQVALTSLAHETRAVVVTGTLKEGSKEKSIIPVESYSANFFNKNQASTLFENISMVNGVRPQLNCNVCNTGDIHINGMEGPYTMVMVDGMVNVSGLSTVYGLSGIPSSMIERVEVSKGPSSTLYGSEALAGVINVITKNPFKAPRAYVNVFYTSHGELNADASMALRKKKVSSLLGINYFRFQRQRDVNKDNFTDITLQHRISLFNKWEWKRKANRKASVGLRYYYEDRWGGELQWKPSFRGTDSIYGESIYTARYELLAKYQLPLSSMRVFYNQSTNWHQQNSVYGNSLFLASQAISFHQLYWDIAGGPGHDALLGITLRYTYQRDNTPASFDSLSNQYRPFHTWLPGVFIQDEWKMTENHSLLAGLRYDYTRQHGHILSPRLAYKAVYRKATFRLSGGNGFRVVNVFTEDHASLTSARRVVFQEALKPERSWNLTAQYAQKWPLHSNHFLSWDFTGFYTYFSNQILPDYTDPEKILYRNLRGHAVSKGLAWNVEYQYSDRLILHGGITYVRAYRDEEDSIGIRQRQVQVLNPVVSATSTVTLKFPALQTEVHYNGLVYGPMWLPVFPNDYRPERSPTYALHSLQVNKKWGEQWEIFLSCKNLLNFYPKEDIILRAFDPFDKRIAINNPNNYTFDPTYNYAPMQGRRWVLGLRWQLP